MGTPALAWLGRNVNTVTVGPQLLGVPFQARTVHVSGECITVKTSRTSYYCYYVDVDTNYRTTQSQDCQTGLIPEHQDCEMMRDVVVERGERNLF